MGDILGTIRNRVNTLSTKKAKKQQQQSITKMTCLPFQYFHIRSNFEGMAKVIHVKYIFLVVFFLSFLLQSYEPYGKYVNQNVFQTRNMNFFHK